MFKNFKEPITLLPKINIDFSHNYFLQVSIKKLEEKAVIFLVGTLIRFELPLIYLRLVKGVQQKNQKILSFGFNAFFTFPYINFGNSLIKFFTLFEGRHSLVKYFATFAKENVFFLLSSLNLTRFDFLGESCKTFSLNRGFLFSYMLTTLNLIAALDTNLMTKHFGGSLFLLKKNFFGYLFNVNDDNLLLNDKAQFCVFYSGSNFLVDTFKQFTLNPRIPSIKRTPFYFSSFTRLAVLFPLTFVLERTVKYFNLEGRFFESEAFVFPTLSNIRTNWTFLIALDFFLSFSKYGLSRQTIKRMYLSLFNTNFWSFLGFILFPALNYQLFSLEVSKGFLSYSFESYLQTDIVTRSSLSLSLMATRQKMTNLFHNFK